MKRSRIIKAFLVVATLAAVLLIAKAWADRQFHSHFMTRAATVKLAAGRQSGAVVTEADLVGLPDLLARYMRFSGVVGKRRISSVHIVHSGRFRLGADKPWLPIEGEYVITTAKPSFSWYGKLSMAPGVTVSAFDSYFDGSGRMLVKAMSAFTIVDGRSKEIDVSAFGRCVAEMTLAPSFFLDRSKVSCAPSGDNRLKCTVTDGRFSTDPELSFNADGSLDRIVVPRYFDRGTLPATLERFTGQGHDPKAFSGLTLPSRVDGYWNLAEGDLHYVDFSIDSVEYE